MKRSTGASCVRRGASSRTRIVGIYVFELSASHFPNAETSNSTTVKLRECVVGADRNPHTSRRRTPPLPRKKHALAQAGSRNRARFYQESFTAIRILRAVRLIGQPQRNLAP